MNEPGKRRSDDLRRIQNALIQSIMDLSPAELRMELREADEDPDAYVALADAMLADAEAYCARERLERAKAEVIAFRAGQGSPPRPGQSDAGAGLETLRARLMSTPMTLAARKDEGLSERDKGALLEAMAELERLEAEDETE